MKRLFTLFVLCVLTSVAFAQNLLTYEDESVIGDAYANAGDTARVRIRCHESTPLSFYSRLDGGNIEPFEVSKEGSYDIYDFHFPTDGADAEFKLLSKRVLVVSTRNHNNLEIPLNLVPKQYVKMRVYDPDDNSLNSPYIRLRNQAFVEFKAMNYTRAKQLFLQAQQMSDADKDEAAVNINLVDSCIYYREKADEAYNNGKYLDSYHLYTRVAALNNDDSYAVQRKQESNNHYKGVCDMAYTKAEYLFNEKKYAEAREQYELMLNEKCPETIPLYSNVESRMQLIDEIVKSKKNHSTVITYEWSKDTPFGFHVGKYKEHKWSGFFQMDCNKLAIEAMRSNATYGDTPELNLSFGWTVKLVKPVWLFFGPGVTGKMYYGEFQDDKYPTKDYSATSTVDKGYLVSDGDMEKLNAAVAVSPVIGILVKYSYFAVRASYQYRFALKKELEDFLGKSRFSVGVGLAF